MSGVIHNFFSKLDTTFGIVFNITKRITDNKLADIDEKVLPYCQEIIKEFESKDPHHIISLWIKRTKSSWGEIKKRNSHFFTASADHIFEDIPSKHINSFKTLFTINPMTKKTLVTDEETTELWDYFQVLTKLAIRYIEEKKLAKHFDVDLPAALALFSMSAK